MTKRLASTVAMIDSNHVLQPLQFGSGQFVELAILFFILAIVAAVLGVRGVAGVSMDIAKWLIIIFIVLAILSVVL
ncbi:DUF1328 domain-containing protein [Haloarchaeobius sp. DYHT-AS-18]|uniref:DUF1328 domain-containing protein n=1 Tax=Haloarchaeobius sp. DYHT-AS-18 TaxID=3446117 RepID=UPI003EB74827